MAVRPRCCPWAARLSRGLGGHAGHTAGLGLSHLQGMPGEQPKPAAPGPSLLFPYYVSASAGPTGLGAGWTKK